MKTRTLSILTLIIGLLIFSASSENMLAFGQKQGGGGGKKRAQKEAAEKAAAENKADNNGNADKGDKKARQWALLIGINDYPGQIQDLRFAKQDALSIKEALIKEAGFREDHIVLLTDEGEKAATKANIFSAIDDNLAPKIKSGDEVIVFLAGHGFSSGLGTDAKGYFLPVDVDASDKDALEKTALPLEKLSRKLGRLKASQFTLFVDACRDDPFPGRGIKGNPLTDVMARGLRIAPPEDQPNQPVTTITFYSCQVGERAYENESLGHGVFSYYILSGIKELAAKPDGRVEAGILANYLRENVTKWAKEYAQKVKYSASQTPTMVATEIRGPIYVLSTLTPSPAAPNSPQNGGLNLIASPDNANLSLNGQALGKGPLHKELAPGQYKIRAEQAGFQPLETEIKVVAGYNQELSLVLKPLSSSVNYEKGVQFENQRLIPQAIAAFEQALQEDPNSVATYQKLGSVYIKANRARDAVDLLTTAMQKFGDNPSVIAQYSRALTAWAEKEEKLDISTNANRPAKAIKYVDAKKEAIKAGELAVQKGGNLAASQLALGFAYLLDEKDRSKATPIFVKASVLAPEDAEAYYGAGYSYRLLNQPGQAIPQLNKALELRPEYYEAQRELAYCYHAQGNTDEAINHYEAASSYRAKTNNNGEMAGNNLALSALYQQKGKEVGGTQGNAFTETSKGYETDARTYDPTLKVALAILSGVGLSSRISSFLPPDVSKLLNNVKVPDKVTDKVKVPGDKVKIPKGKLPF